MCCGVPAIAIRAACQLPATLHTRQRASTRPTALLLSRAQASMSAATHTCAWAWWNGRLSRRPTWCCTSGGCNQLVACHHALFVSEADNIRSRSVWSLPLSATVGAGCHPLLLCSMRGCAPCTACLPAAPPCRIAIIALTAAVAVHHVLPCRYFRFFPDGTFAYRTSPEPLSKVGVVMVRSGCPTRGLALWQLHSGLASAGRPPPRALPHTQAC